MAPPIHASKAAYFCCLSVRFMDSQWLHLTVWTLSKCDLKKVQWYLSRNLADVITDNPLTIKLRFEPHGKGHAGVPYYMAAKENKCVACGEEEKLVKHSIVPHCYRTHFPERYKGRTSHDIVLLCNQCHCVISGSISNLRSLLVKEFDIQPRKRTSTMDPRITKVRGYAAALSKKRKSRPSIPPHRINAMEAHLKEFLEKSELTEEDLEYLLNLDAKKPNLERKAWIEKEIVEKLKVKGEDALLEFIKRWRVNFLTILQPKFMPEFWDVGHDFPRQ